MAKWIPPKRSQGRPEFTYMVAHVVNGNGNFSKTLQKSNSTSQKLDNLIPDATYSIEVLAIPKDKKKDMFYCTKDIRVNKGEKLSLLTATCGQ